MQSSCFSIFQVPTLDKFAPPYTSPDSAQNLLLSDRLWAPLLLYSQSLISMVITEVQESEGLNLKFGQQDFQSGSYYVLDYIQTRTHSIMVVMDLNLNLDSFPLT